ncbi:hypothetical protein I553_8845 [Mycobacterium xenopi 4042]|uniref:Uncharacterized protein n=1 Tax=Mycobacterium xenopi 4042 TaxID=1299334 RepID=X8CLV9_MYCXE|nr:hypothetical protein I553_8845 [Mycobacterium xenopi 4042]
MAGIATSRATKFSRLKRLSRRGGHPQQRGHQRHLLDLFAEEPLHELLAEVVAFVAGRGGQPADLLGDGTLLVKRQRQRLCRGVEPVADGAHTGDFDTEIAVEQMLYQHHRVISLLHRLPVEVVRKLRQMSVVEINRNRNILLGSSEFVVNLLLQQCVEFRFGYIPLSHTSHVTAAQRRLSCKVILTEASVP